jgi:hypothetical protein
VVYGTIVDEFVDFLCQFDYFLSIFFTSCIYIFPLYISVFFPLNFRVGRFLGKCERENNQTFLPYGLIFLELAGVRCDENSM